MSNSKFDAAGKGANSYADAGATFALMVFELVIWHDIHK
jgi:hypothetical protein